MIKMNLQQVEYLLVLNKFRNFSKAAQASFVTQPAMTIQIKNLENELGVTIFDRTKKPLIPTEIGLEVIKQARVLQKEVERIKDIADTFGSELKGKLKIGIIPTVAPYLVPLFINNFIKKYSNITLDFIELITDDIIKKLKESELDVGIIVTPYEMNGITVFPLYYEKFYAYVSKEHPLYKKKKINTTDINLESLWLLEEGNCFRNQVINICSKDVKSTNQSNFLYESLSIDALRKIVEHQMGVTVIPELAVNEININKRDMIKPFNDYVPVREVSIIVDRSYLKKRLIDKLREEILKTIPVKMKKIKGELINTKI